MGKVNFQGSQYTSLLVEVNLEPLIVFNMLGIIITVNQATKAITGIENNMLIGSKFFDCFTEPIKAKKVCREVFKKGFITDSPLTFIHKNSTVANVLLNGSVYLDEKGAVIGAVVVARDVAGQKWAAELRIANKELAFQNDEKEKRAAELLIANKELKFQNEEKEKEQPSYSLPTKNYNIRTKKKVKERLSLSLPTKN